MMRWDATPAQLKNLAQNCGASLIGLTPCRPYRSVRFYRPPYHTIATLAFRLGPWLFSRLRGPP